MPVELDESQVAQFFADARERHAIYLRRRAGRPKPWTDDPVMQNYKITNVFRELDRTTTWIRTHVRDPLQDSPLSLPAVALARWFNLISTLETIFLQPSLLLVDSRGAAGVGGGAPDPNPRAGGAPDPAPAAGSAAGLLPVSGSAAGLSPVSGSAAGLLPTDGAATPWQRWLKTEDTRELEWPLRKQGAPWVTGAYMIRTPVGMDKLEGVLSSFRNLWTQRPKFEIFRSRFVPMGWREVAEHCLENREKNPVTLEAVWDWLKNFYGLGPFMAHEIVIDLRHTALLDRAPDIRSWTNPGPGALRGANILIRGAKQGRKGRLEKSSVAEAKDTILQLQDLAQDPKYWPQERQDGFAVDPSYAGQIEDVLRHAKSGDWPQWEMHQGEMMLCEYTKIIRTRLGYGRPRGNYQGVS